MFIEIMYSIILNMSVLLLFAQLITRIHPVKRIIINQESSLKNQFILIIFFGLLGIFATLSGVTIHGAIVNVRTIAVVSGGILFGPIVGIGGGIIAAIHRLFLAVTTLLVWHVLSQPYLAQLLVAISTKNLKTKNLIQRLF